ncbi:hypothetical protein NDU88_001456 [Pleurodeles waltl]|uniref:Uncharacterized protein n=1 Tax=Pleurodeles waltl TaxID=8319 RepID=A0AAV7U6W6_PLEWA|nr:hypothetical protein NDU88_001456 [Pleurodeles waltl]
MERTRPAEPETLGGVEHQRVPRAWLCVPGRREKPRDREDDDWVISALWQLVRIEADVPEEVGQPALASWHSLKERDPHSAAGPSLLPAVCISDSDVMASVTSSDSTWTSQVALRSWHQ